MCNEQKHGSKGQNCCGTPHGMHGMRGMHGMKGMHGFKQMMGHFMKQYCHGPGAGILYNVDDIGDSYVISVLLPGRDKEDVKVSLINGYLNIKAPKPKEIKTEETEKKEEQPTRQYGRHAFRFIDVNMDVPLPPGSNSETIKSVMANGLLKIKIEKNPAKSINVDDENN